MWINSVKKFQLLKEIQRNYSLSKRTIILIKGNLNLVVLLKFFPRNLLKNENLLYNLLKKYQDLELPFIINNELQEFSLPFSDKKIYKFYNEMDLHEILFCSKIANKVNTDLVIHPNKNLSKKLLDCLLYVHNKLDIKIKDTDYPYEYSPDLVKINNSEFCIDGNAYSFSLLTKPKDIALWGVYLDNCLDSYVKGKRMSLFCDKTKTKYNITCTVLLEKGVIHLVGILKNNKPYACLELIDKDLKIHQILRTKNKILCLTEQHNILTELDNKLERELSFSSKYTEEQTYREHQLTVRTDTCDEVPNLEEPT